MDFEVRRCDISSMETDAVVLPANPRLREGDGASRALFEKAGRSELKDALKQYGRVEEGSAVLTPGFGLPARYIVHAVVPKWTGGNGGEYETLCAAYLSSLTIADSAGCESIAFPLLSAGNNGFDLQLAIDIAIESIMTYCPANKLDKACLVVFDERAVEAMREMGRIVDELGPCRVAPVPRKYKGQALREAVGNAVGVAGGFIGNTVGAAGAAAGVAAGDAAGVAGNAAGGLLNLAKDVLEVANKALQDPAIQREIAKAAIRIIERKLG